MLQVKYTPADSVLWRFELCHSVSVGGNEIEKIVKLKWSNFEEFEISEASKLKKHIYVNLVKTKLCQL